MKWKLVLVLLLFLTLLSTVHAVDINTKHHITLLSVSLQENATYKGGTAELFLEVVPGSGSVFIESYPLSKIDTQVATQFANEIACEFSSVDCSKYDFFYTIHANAPIIGGPSAGGASALLTLSVLKEIPLRDDIAMTGTISSGGIIGPVAGVYEKVLAASQTGKKIALVPYFSFLDNQTIFNQTRQDYQNASSEFNISVDSVFPFEKTNDFSQLNITVKKITTLQEALDLAAKQKYSYEQSTIQSIPSSYTEKMRFTAEQLCDRTSSLFTELGVVQPALSVNESHTPTTSNNTKNDLLTDATSYYERALHQQHKKNYYAMASFCYTANLRLRDLLLQNASENNKQENKKRLEQSLRNLEQQLDRQSITTFSDLETFFIVKERILEANRYLEQLHNTTNISSQQLAFAIERYYSAIVWSNFFDLPATSISVEDKYLKDACFSEIQGVKTRFQYLQTLFSQEYFESIQEGIDYAQTYAQNNEFALCLFKASKTKADLNLFLSTLGLHNSSLSELVVLKQQRTQHLIADQLSRNIFPLLGYSYYEYVTVLLDDEPSTALLFSEYALALSDLEDYFPKKKTVSLFSDWRPFDTWVLVIGIIFGIVLALTLLLFFNPLKK